MTNPNPIPGIYHNLEEKGEGPGSVYIQLDFPMKGPFPTVILFNSKSQYAYRMKLPLSTEWIRSLIKNSLDWDRFFAKKDFEGPMDLYAYSLVSVLKRTKISSITSKSLILQVHVAEKAFPRRIYFSDGEGNLHFLDSETHLTTAFSNYLGYGYN